MPPGEHLGDTSTGPPPWDPQETPGDTPKGPLPGRPSQGTPGNTPGVPIPAPQWDPPKGTPSRGPPRNNLQNNPYIGHPTWFPWHRNRYRWHHTGDPLQDTSDTRDILQGIPNMWPYPRDTLQDTPCRGPLTGTPRVDALNGTKYRGQYARDHG
jgi:hypothetical protein